MLFNQADQGLGLPSQFNRTGPIHLLGVLLMIRIQSEIFIPDFFPVPCLIYPYPAHYLIVEEDVII